MSQDAAGDNQSPVKIEFFEGYRSTGVRYCINGRKQYNSTCLVGKDLV